MNAPFEFTASSLEAGADHRGADTASSPSTTSQTEATPAVAKAKKSLGGGNRKGNSAERRATHNAVERDRRNILNIRFLELAASLPATCDIRRPSKRLIVTKSLDFVRSALRNDAVLRLKLDEIMRHNHSLLQEVNQLRAERGQSPHPNTTSYHMSLSQPQPSKVRTQSMPSNVYHAARPTPLSVPSSNTPAFSTDALIAAFSIPGLPQPLASAEFTKQVTEQRISFDIRNAHQQLGNECDEDYSNVASADDLSAAGSDHSSPSLADDGASALAMAAAANWHPTNAIFPYVGTDGVHVPTTQSLATPTTQQQPLYSAFAHHQPLANSYSPSAVSSAFSEGSSAYAHYQASPASQHHVTISSVPAMPTLDFVPPITPTTNSMYQHFMASIDASNASRTEAQDAQRRLSNAMMNEGTIGSSEVSSASSHYSLPA